VQKGSKVRLKITWSPFDRTGGLPTTMSSGTLFIRVHDVENLQCVSGCAYGSGQPYIKLFCGADVRRTRRLKGPTEKVEQNLIFPNARADDYLMLAAFDGRGVNKVAIGNLSIPLMDVVSSRDLSVDRDLEGCQAGRVKITLSWR